MTYPLDFALLAPVPLEHLADGVLIAKAHEYVAFGSMKFEFFRQLDELRTGYDVLALLYASHEGASDSDAYQIGWRGWYTGSEEIRGGKSKSEELNRPSTTKKYAKDNARFWAVFWHVTKLEQLASSARFPVHKTRSYKTLAPKKDAAPRCPQLIWLPELNWPDL